MYEVTTSNLVVAILYRQGNRSLVCIRPTYNLTVQEGNYARHFKEIQVFLPFWAYQMIFGYPGQECVLHLFSWKRHWLACQIHGGSPASSLRLQIWQWPQVLCRRFCGYLVHLLSVWMPHP